MGQEGVNTAGWARVIEAQHSNEATIRSLADQNERSVNELDELCKVFHEHFAQLFGGQSEGKTSRSVLTLEPLLRNLWGMRCVP